MGHQYVLVYIFSGWVEAMPCCKPDALTVTKNLLEKLENVSHWDMPSKCSLKAIYIAKPSAI